MKEKGTGPHNSPVVKNFAQATTIGISFMVPLALGTVAGIFADRWLHTQPALLIILFTLGVGVGFYQVVKEVRKLNKNE